MVIRILKQAPKSRSTFAHSNPDVSPITEDQEDAFEENEEIELEPEPPFDDSAPRLGRGRPKTARGIWIDAYMVKHKCSRYKAQLAANAAKLPISPREKPQKRGPSAEPKKKPKRKVSSTPRRQTEPRKPITIAIPLRILDHYQAGGPGYQSRMIEDLFRAINT